MIKDEKYYRELSEVYLFELTTRKNDIIKVSIAMGIIVSMESDLIIFEKKKGKNEKSEEQWDRLNMLRSSIEHFQAMANKNQLLRERLSVESEARWNAEQELNQVKQELAELKNSIELHESE